MENENYRPPFDFSQMGQAQMENKVRDLIVGLDLAIKTIDKLQKKIKGNAKTIAKLQEDINTILEKVNANSGNIHDLQTELGIT